MAVINVGTTLVDGGFNDGANWTIVDGDTPANGTGIITSVSIRLGVAGNVEVALFEALDAWHLTTRSNADLGALPIGLSTVNGLSLAVVTGDRIGFYSAVGAIRRGGVAAVTDLLVAGDKIPCVNTNFSTTNRRHMFTGTGTTIPAISGLSANHGAVGDSITITGTSFDPVQAPSGQVTFNGTVASITSWGDLSIVCTVPVGATSGNIVVTNSTGGVSAGTAFTVDTNPVISGLSPDTGPVGTSVTITGTVFGAVQGTVRFNGALASITSWTDTQIVAVVPIGATTGAVVVVNSAGAASNNYTMTVTDVPPTVSTGNPTGDDEAVDFYACVRLGQFFVPTASMQPTYVKVKGGRSGNPGITTFEIHAADAGGLPVGPILASGSTDANTWTTDATGQWVLIPVASGVHLQAGQRYTLTWYAAAGDAGNKGKGRRQSAGSDPTGGALYSADCGSSWSVVAGKDYVFAVIGKVSRPAAPPQAGQSTGGTVGAASVLGWPPVRA